MSYKLQDAATLSQAEVQKMLLDRGGNRGIEFNSDYWEGFTNNSKINSKMMAMNNNLTDLPPDSNQIIITNFLKDRGGNRGPSMTSSKSLESSNLGNFLTKEGFQNVNIGKFEPDEKFYPGDKILAGNYFDGWNDTFFFNKSIFRENLEFWQNPFKENAKSK
jgi:hypothetical protein